MKHARAFSAMLAVLVWGSGAARVDAVDRSVGAGVAKPAIEGQRWSRRAKARLARDVDALLAAAPALRGAHVGLLALDTRSGDVLYARNADDAFIPASTMKLLTGSTALATLGPGYRFHTEAYLAGAMYHGAPKATLFMRAGGDPLLRSDDVVAMTQAVLATGALPYPYAVNLDASAFDFAPYPPGWSWDDFPYDYAAKLSPMPVDENAGELTVAPGSNAGDPLELRENAVGSPGRTLPTAERCPAGPATPLAVPGVTAERDTPADIDIIRTPPGNCLEAVGSLPAGGQPQTIDFALSEPTANLYGLVFQTLAVPSAGRPARPALGRLAEHLYRSSPVPPGARLVWSHDGEPLSDLLADMWWPSDNFVAEMLLRAIGLQHSGRPGTTDHGADAERAWLASIGVDPASLTIADGSGLSSYDRMTPRALGAILQADWNGPYRDIVLDDLPVAGVRGTLEKSFAGTLAERRTFAKTGSMNHTRGLAGYLVTLRHGAVTFAWSVDDWLGGDADLNALRAQVLSRLIGD